MALGPHCPLRGRRVELSSWVAAEGAELPDPLPGLAGAHPVRRCPREMGRPARPVAAPNQGLQDLHA